MDSLLHKVIAAIEKGWGLIDSEQITLSGGTILAIVTVGLLGVELHHLAAQLHLAVSILLLPGTWPTDQLFRGGCLTLAPQPPEIT